MLITWSFCFLCLSIFSSSPLSAGPGPVDSPNVSELHSRSATVTWDPPSQPNGIITNYTLYLCPQPGSVSSTSTILDSNLGPRLSLLPSTEGVYLNSGHNLRPTPSYVTPGSGHIFMSTFNRSTNNSSSTIRGPKPNLLSNLISSLRPGVSGDKNIESSRLTNTSHGHGSISFHPTEPSTSSVSPGPLPYNPDNNGTSLNTEHFIQQDPFHSPLSSSFGEASDSSSVTVPGNTTSYTFLDLLPHHTYSLQVLYVIPYRTWYYYGRICTVFYDPKQLHSIIQLKKLSASHIFFFFLFMWFLH